MLDQLIQDWTILMEIHEQLTINYEKLLRVAGNKNI